METIKKALNILLFMILCSLMIFCSIINTRLLQFISIFVAVWCMGFLIGYIILFVRDVEEEK